jgi:hypothetical protein
MGVTRIRYLLDQWRLRSVAVGLQHGFGKERPRGDWPFPSIEEPRRKPLGERGESEPPKPPPS